jgi:hypothetical protein
MVGQSTAQGCAEALIAVGLQQLVQAIHIDGPDPGAPVHQLGEVLMSFRAYLQQMLAFQIPASPW